MTAGVRADLRPQIRMQIRLTLIGFCRAGLLYQR